MTLEEGPVPETVIASGEPSSMRDVRTGRERRASSTEGRARVAGRLAVQLALGALAAMALVALLWPFLPALVTASVLALILHPLHRWALGRTGRPGLAAGLTAAVGIAGLLIPLFALGAVVLREAAGFAEWIARDGPAALRSLPQLERAVDGVAARFGLGEVEAGRAAATWVRGVPSFLAGRAFGLLAGLGGLAVQGGISAFTLFFLLRDGDRIQDLIHRLVPLESEHTRALHHRVREVVGAAVYGNLLVAFAQGLMGGTAFLLLGLSTPVLWGAVMGAASLVPMVGPGLVWLPTSLFLIATGSPIRGVALLAVGVGVISTVDNVLRAIFMGARARVHPLVVFLGVLGGIVLFGMVGVFVGPVVLVVSLLLLEMVRLALFTDGPDAATREAPTPRP